MIRFAVNLTFLLSLALSSRFARPQHNSYKFSFSALQINLNIDGWLWRSRTPNAHPQSHSPSSPPPSLLRGPRTGLAATVLAASIFDDMSTPGPVVVCKNTLVAEDLLPGACRARNVSRSPSRQAPAPGQVLTSTLANSDFIIVKVCAAVVDLDLHLYEKEI